MTKEITPNFYYLTPQKYSDKTGLPYGTVLYLCKNGDLDAHSTDGGQWHIKVLKENAVSPEEHRKLQEENIELKATLNAARKLLAI